ncbi:GNAT family protein [Terrabacter sp. NPDC080008]|uniref:GNAT family N-acetyltransferase n=1 Tax=Terrabacter sp. NPDC080008 TaxID=3155176 RepID=UPI00344DDE00
MLEKACFAPTGAPLVGRFVRLDVTTPDDADGLFAVYSDPRCYEQGYVMARPHRTVAETEALVEAAVAARAADGTGRTAYTIRLVADGGLGAGGTVVGTSSLGDVDTVREHVHLGWTMYGSRWWGTQVNPEAKLLLLGHAFDTCGFGRVKIQTDVVNERSRAAILRLGATFEGVTRRDVRRADGSWRDTAVHSILVDEWPAVRARLLARLASP